MWLFLPGGFLSVVAHRDHPDVLICWGRVKGDVERLLPARAVFETPDADYRFRGYLDRDTVASVIAGHVARIDYPKFKPAVTDKRRMPAYFAVWDQLWQLQSELADKKPVQGSFRRTRSGKLVMA
jgi:hypothetical protein